MKYFKSYKWPASIGFYITAVFITIFLSSCNIFGDRVGQQEQAVPTEAAVSAAEEESADISAVNEITIWDKLEPKEQIELMNSIEQFIAVNQEIKINTRHFRSEEELIDQFRAASLAGAGPELLIASLESSAALAEASVIKPITDDMTYPDIFNGLVEISNHEDKSYVIPFRAYDYLMLFYNREFVDEAPASFAELMQYCEEVNIPAEETFGFIFNVYEADWIIPFVGGYQDWIYDYATGAISLDSQAMINTLEFLVMIYNEEELVPYGYEYEEINNAFKTGKAHMIINGNWAIEEYIEEGMDFGVAKIPIVWEGYKNPTPMLNGIGFMINANTFSKALDTTRSLIDYLMSEKIHEQWTQKTSTMPSLKSMADSSFIASNQVYSAEMQQIEICRGKPPEEALRAIRAAIMMNLENVLNGNISPEEAAVKMQEDVIKLRSGSTINDIETNDTSGTSETSAQQQ